MLGADKVLFTLPGPFGVPVQVGTTLLLLPLIFISFGDIAYFQYDLLFIAMLIVSILAHEVGHAWGCKVQGIPVKRVMIHGGGGFCEHGRAPSLKAQEFIVAMGPIVNLALWAMAGLLAPAFDYGMIGWALYWFAQINLFLALFNLLPVHPLDGGKLFHLGLLRFLPPLAATRISGGVGVVFAVLWLPGMIWLFLNIGIVLFFVPPLRAHWRMMHAKG